jgi:hypothetical protein
VLWLVFFGLVGISEDIAWPPEVWSGSVLLGGLGAWTAGQAVSGMSRPGSRSPA